MLVECLTGVSEVVRAQQGGNSARHVLAAFRNGMGIEGQGGGACRSR